jgi:hypothetical protein
MAWVNDAGMALRISCLTNARLVSASTLHPGGATSLGQAPSSPDVSWRCVPDRQRRSITCRVNGARMNCNKNALNPALWNETAKSKAAWLGRCNGVGDAPLAPVSLIVGAAGWLQQRAKMAVAFTRFDDDNHRLGARRAGRPYGPSFSTV